MEVLREAPEISSFIPLVEHQSATPASFYSGPPVLHYYSDRCKVLILDRDLSSVPALAEFASGSTGKSGTGDSAINGDSTHENEEVQKTIEDVDIWVTSEYVLLPFNLTLLTIDSKLLLFCNTSSVGVAIPYPSISLHAIQSLPHPTPGEQQGLYMQLISFSPETEEDTEPDSVSVTLIPTASAPPTAETAAEGTGPTSEDPVATEGEPEQSPVVALFTALSDCSNLHPDPVEQGDEEDGESRLMQAGLIMPGDSQGGLPPAMPGSGGWITAENMHEFFDADGNYIGPDDEEQAAGDLGPGAGTIRARDDEMDTTEGTDDTKWQRTG